MFKQYVNSTQQNGFSNNSACMYQSDACRWPGRVGWGGMLTLGPRGGTSLGREILEEMMFTSPVGLVILRYPCSENLTMRVQYVWTPKNLFCVSAYLESVWEKQKKKKKINTNYFTLLLIFKRCLEIYFLENKITIKKFWLTFLGTHCIS